MNVIDFSRHLEIFDKQKNTVLVSCFGDKTKNKKSAKLDTAKKSRQVNVLFRQINEVANEIINVGNHFFFDYNFNQASIFNKTRTDIHNKIFHVLHWCKSHKEHLAINNIFQIIELCSDLIIWINANAKKSKFTGLEVAKKEIKNLPMWLDGD